MEVVAWGAIAEPVSKRDENGTAGLLIDVSPSEFIWDQLAPGYVREFTDAELSEWGDWFDIAIEHYQLGPLLREWMEEEKQSCK